MRDFRLTQERVAKGWSYPMRRCSLEAAFEVADVKSVDEVRFHRSPGNPLIEAWFQGVGRSAPWAGRCRLRVGVIPFRHAREIESLVLGEAIPKLLQWLRIAEKRAFSAPKDLSRWQASLVNGELVYWSAYARPRKRMDAKSATTNKARLQVG